MIIADPEFEVGQLVYHKTPEGLGGIVADIRYSLRTKTFIYEVSVDWDTNQAYEHELSANKIF